MEYSNVKILDCNRQHSTQALAGNNENPALFTNVLGKGVQLKIGDKISVHGSYISEIGAGADTVELKGQGWNKMRTVKYIEDKNTFPPDLFDGQEPLIGGFQDLRSQVSDYTYYPKDNETVLQSQYYLNTNGESGYVLLPRRWNTPSVAAALSKLDQWTLGDKFTEGRPLGIVDSVGATTGIRQYLFDDYQFIYGGDGYAIPVLAEGYLQLRNDNSRFTLMRRIDPVGTGTYLRDITRPKEGGTPVVNPFPVNTNPAYDDYEIYKDIIPIKVPAGFNSPNNISVEITKQLKQAGTGQVFSVVGSDGKAENMSLTYDTATYKPFLCGTDSTWSKAAWTAYNTRGALDKQSALDYNSNFYNIYCKRPELRMSGTKMNDKKGGFITSPILGADKNYSTIKTSYLWSDIGLLRDHFKDQKRYPELFDNTNMIQMIPNWTLGSTASVANARMLHMNPLAQADNILGGDNLGATVDTDANRQSYAFFIEFQSEYEDILTDGNNIAQLAYGFATKYKSGGEYFIELHTAKIGGINRWLFGETGADTIETTRRIGYDRHFNSYGSAYIAGYNGRLEGDFLENVTWGSGNNPLFSSNLRQNYVGANNPVCEYDPNQSRFYFSQLHTAEVSGQEAVGAGGPTTGTVAPVPSIPDNTAQGGNEVYKINKRVTPYTFTSAMKPYELSATGKADNKNPNPITVSVMNRNIQPWQIFDSNTGIYLSDFGYDDDEFSEGLWGILGFTKNQLTAQVQGNNNRLARIDNDNIEDLSIVTTNCQVVSTDTRDYIVNQFGAVYFTTQIPTVSRIKLKSVSEPSVHARKDYDQYPAITQGTSSIKILARNLPRKMLRPYYCIRSDIIDGTHYIGGEDGRQPLSIVALCSKQYSGGDFYFSNESDLEFTVTKARTVTSVTTAITDPSQSLSRVDPYSSVIYKITSLVENEVDLTSEFLKDKK
tara:strand:- start:2545 stop:5367 length:2823 start_codon:yes stop_codon:yes gene_type:complete